MFRCEFRSIVILLLTNSVDWCPRCCYRILVGGSGRWPGVITNSSDCCRRLLCVLLLVLSVVVRCPRRWYRRIRSTIRRRALRWHGLYPCLVVGVIGRVKCCRNVLDGICRICLVMWRRRVRSCVITLVVERCLTSLSWELLNELILPT